MAKDEAKKVSEIKVESDIYLAYPTDKGDVVVHFKVSSDGPEVLDDVEQIIKEKVVEGSYKPNTFEKNGGGNGGGHPASSGAGRSSFGGARRGSSGQGGSGSGLPDRFQLDGVTWYVNNSTKQPGQKYIGRKGPNGYEYLDWEEAPDFIRQAYGK